MCAQPAAAIKKSSGSLNESELVAAIISGVASKVASDVREQVAELLAPLLNPAPPPPDPNQMIKWDEVCELRDQILQKTRKSVRQTIWKDVKLGILDPPYRISTRTARWKRGDVIAAYQAYLAAKT